MKGPSVTGGSLIQVSMAYLVEENCELEILTLAVERNL